ncbi:MAG: substrate-binding domain-containing protein [Magnetococcales bacterium]|nr:substrate-binding domain-containing protein [Magnetococcales bacterium]
MMILLVVGLPHRWAGGATLNADALSQVLVIAGTGDSQALLRHVARRFEQDHLSSGILVDVPDSIGSGGGILALQKGLAQLARIARPMKQREQAGLLSIPFAISPIVFAVHPSVTGIESLTRRQILDIYSGAVNNWAQVGGRDHKIYVVNRERGDASRTVLENSLIKREVDWRAGKIFFSTPRAAKAIANHPYTIGFLPLSVAFGSGLKILSIDGVQPGEASVTSGEYPHFLFLELVAKKPVTGWEQKFMRYLFEPKIRNFMNLIGIYPVSGGLPPGL